ncbi:MAG: sodium/solute symporter [Pseudomonadales bacterium]|nr:sodium/solute symporter [Pseudomonadales bacterium]
MNPLDLGIIVAYLVLIVAVGLTISRRVHSARDFFLAGRSLTWWVIGLSIIGTNVSANGYVGASGGAYKVGIAQANFEWIGAIPAMIVASLIFIPLYWRAGVYSIPEYLGLRYNDSVRVLSAGIASIFAVFAMAVSLWAIALTLQTYLGWPLWLGIAVTGVVVGLYSISGGLAAVAFTDALQVVIMFIGGAAVMWIGVSDAGGLVEFANKLTAHNGDHLKAYLPADHEEFPWPGVIFGLGIVLSPAYWIGGQAILQRTLGARSQWDASAAMMFAAFAKTFVPLLIVFPGLLALVMQAQIEYPDMALPWVVKNVLPPGLSGLMFIAIIAALQSSLDSSLNSTALMITRDIRGVLYKRSNRDHDLSIGRWLTLGLLLSAMIFAPFIGDLGGIYFFIQTLLSLFQGPMLALLVLGAFTVSVTATAGVVTVVSGIALAALLMINDLNMLYVAFYTFLYSLACLLVVSRFTEARRLEDIRHLVYRYG